MITNKYFELRSAEAVINAFAKQLEFAGFKVTIQKPGYTQISNAWYSIGITTTKVSYCKNGGKDRSYPIYNLHEVLQELLRIIDYGTHYVYVAGLAICPLQKFGKFNTKNKLIDLFRMLCDGNAELVYKSDKVFRWRLSNNRNIEIKQSSTSLSNEKEEPQMLEQNTTMDILSLVAAAELYEVQVRFHTGGGNYSYKSETPYEVGDAVIVDTPNSGLQVVTVQSCERGLNGGNFPKYKWIVCKVDRARYDELLAKEEETIKLIKTAQQADRIKRELEALGLNREQIIGMLGLAPKTDSQ